MLWGVTLATECGIDLGDVMGLWGNKNRMRFIEQRCTGYHDRICWRWGIIKTG